METIDLCCFKGTNALHKNILFSNFVGYIHTYENRDCGSLRTWKGRLDKKNI